MQQYAVPNMQEYAQISKKRNMQYMCIISKISFKYAKLCKSKICTYMQNYHMHKYAQNMHKMQNQICINMHFKICINMCFI